MEVNNPLYRNQGIHVITSIFTVEQGEVKVLLIKRKNQPFYGDWVLTGGALYNNEDLIEGAKREIKEKAGIDSCDLYQFGVFGNLNRSPVMRMVAIGFIGVIDSKRVSIIRSSRNTSDAEWFKISSVPKMGYDHNEIFEEALKALKKLIVKSNILKSLFPNGVTLPELQKTYEAILDCKFDRRNFRKKILSLDLLEETDQFVKFEGNKPAKVYKFKKTITEKEIF